jgi:CRISPR-associated protein Csx14
MTEASYADARVAFIATLGGKPQVATFALDILLNERLRVERVVALHLSPNDLRIERSTALLRREFDSHAAYRGRIRFDAVTIRDKPDGVLTALHPHVSGRAIEQVDDFAAADAIWLTTHRLLAALKSEAYRVVLCVTGGPRLVGLMALSAASLLFASHDRCVHLYTPKTIRDQSGEGDVLHIPPGSGVRLVPVPLLPLGMIAPNLQAAASATPEQIIGERRRMLSEHELRRCAEVVRRLTPRQRQVLRELARKHADMRALADNLSISVTTLSTHKARIFEECRIAWAMPHGAKMTA